MHDGAVDVCIKHLSDVNVGLVVPLWMKLESQDELQEELEIFVPSVYG